MIDVLRALAAATLLAAQCPAVASDYEQAEAIFSKNAESLKQASKAIRWTLMERRWKVDSESEGVIQATLDRPDDEISVTVSITFDVTKATITYVKSRSPGRPRRNGKPAPSEPVSRSSYEGWIANLAKDIPIYLERLQIILSEAAQQAVPADVARPASRVVRRG